MAIQSNFPAIKPSLLLDFANTKQLDPRITFTRATTATYYDGVTTAMAEQNLLPYSQEFDNAVWNKNNCAISPNTTTAPDGTSTADFLIENTVNTLHYLSAPIGGGVIGQVYTLSIYAKANTRTIILLYTAMNGNGGTYFDLSAGTIGTTNGVAPTSSAISSVGSGWYRCSITYTATITSGVNAAQCFLVQSGTTVSYLGDGTSGVYVWGAQLEQRSAVTAYTATTTQAITNYIPVLQTAASGVARFDNNPTTGESLGLLIEESRTNLMTYSAQFDNATAWTKTNSTITADTMIAPDGTLSADALIGSATTAAHYLYWVTPSLTSGTAYTSSFYAKAAGYNYVAVASISVSRVANALFDLSTGTVVSTTGTATITSVGNGWYRCTATLTSPSTGSDVLAIALANTNSGGYVPSFAGNGYSGVLIWGAQFEAGAFATSYIPTVASTVTRAADAASMTGTNFSSWYNQGAGTLYAETRALSDTAQSVYNGLSIATTGPNATTMDLLVDTRGSGQTAFYVFNNGASTGTVVVNQTVLNIWNKIAAGYAVNNVTMATNGTLSSTDTSTDIPLGTQLNFGYYSLSVGLFNNGYLRKFAYYPIRVTNTNLQSLTS